MSTSILIIGSGPTGLGAASRLHQLERKFGNLPPYMLVDAAPEAGGLACTDVTSEGFLFDLGGHVIFSHFDYFDGLIDKACGTDTWNTHQRVSYVWMKNRWIPYPFQNNISCLDVDDQVKCLTGLVEAKTLTSTATSKPANFAEWIDRVMGPGINDLFMRPYNFKVWAYPTSEMQCSWLGERVATADVTKAITNVLNNTVAGGWGPNAVFRFPKQGGTGGIWKNVADKCVPQERQRYNSKVVGIDVNGKKVRMGGKQLARQHSLTPTKTPPLVPPLRSHSLTVPHVPTPVSSPPCP
jgi:protoporphyrinogen oxidase